MDTPDPGECVWRLACTESSKVVGEYWLECEEPKFCELKDPKDVVGDDDVNVEVTEAGGNTCRLVIGES